MGTRYNWNGGLDGRTFKEALNGADMRKRIQQPSRSFFMQNIKSKKKEQAVKESDEKEKTIVVEGKVEEGNLEWLHRSIIGETSKQMFISLVQTDCLISGGV